MRAPPSPLRPTLSHALSALGAGLCALYAGRFFLEPAWFAVLCGALGLAHALAAVPPLRARVEPAVAALRVTLCLLAVALWSGEARELWAAAALWVAYVDAAEGRSERAPLLPAFVAVVVLLALGARHPAPRVERAVLLAVVAGALAQRADERRSGARSA